MKLWLGAAILCSVCRAQAPSSLPAPALKRWHTIARGEPFVPMTGRDRADFLLRRTVLSAGAPARAALQAGFDQWTNEPQAWEQGWNAYGRRFGNRWATAAVGNVVESGAAATLGYEQRYIQCNCDGAFRRARHALAMNFVTYDRRGRWVPNIPRVGSTIAAEYAARTWLPHEDRTAGQNARDLALQVATGSLVNIWREFSPSFIRRLKSKWPRR